MKPRGAVIDQGHENAARVDRREFLIRGVKLAGAAAAASSLAAFAASCGTGVTTAPAAGTTTVTPQAASPQAPAAASRNVASVNTSTCRAYNGQRCLMCMSACRENAIYSQDGRPAVDSSRCTGCGKCRFACPTNPASINVSATG